MRLVLAPDWNATHVFEFLIGPSKPNEAIELCKYYMRKSYSEKGYSFVDTFKPIVCHGFQVLFSISDYQWSIFILYDVSKLQAIDGSHLFGDKSSFFEV